MIYFQTTNGVGFTVDEEDYAIVAARKWRCTNKGYISENKSDGKRLHRILLSLGSARPIVDHIDGNPLNNVRSNLRICSTQQNSWNQKKRSKVGGYSSQYRGVYWDKRNRKWRSAITVSNKFICLGRTHLEVVAAKIYNYWAKHYFGEFARLNEV